MLMFVRCMCRPAADASSSVRGIAAETILEDEAEEDVAPTPEQLEVTSHCTYCVLIETSCCTSTETVAKCIGNLPLHVYIKHAVNVCHLLYSHSMQLLLAVTAIND